MVPTLAHNQRRSLLSPSSLIHTRVCEKQHIPAPLFPWLQSSHLLRLSSPPSQQRPTLHTRHPLHHRSTTYLRRSSSRPARKPCMHLSARRLFKLPSALRSFKLPSAHHLSRRLLSQSHVPVHQPPWKRSTKHLASRAHPLLSLSHRHGALSPILVNATPPTRARPSRCSDSLPRQGLQARSFLIPPHLRTRLAHQHPVYRRPPLPLLNLHISRRAEPRHIRLHCLQRQPRHQLPPEQPDRQQLPCHQHVSLPRNRRRQYSRQRRRPKPQQQQQQQQQQRGAAWRVHLKTRRARSRVKFAQPRASLADHSPNHSTDEKDGASPLLQRRAVALADLAKSSRTPR